MVVFLMVVFLVIDFLIFLITAVFSQKSKDTRIIFGFKGMHIQVFANGKNTSYGRNTHQKFQTVRDVKHHVPGNGKKQYVQGAAGCVLDQHADKFNADYQIERVLKEHMKRIIVGIVQEPRHIFYQWYDTDNEANQYDDRHGDFKDFRQQLNPVCESMIFDGTAPDFPFHLLGELFSVFHRDRFA
jgi:hypothetical protein